MTIKARKHIQIFSQNDKVLVFDGENGELGENSEQVLLEMANEHKKLLKSLCNVGTHQHHFVKHGESEKDTVQGVNMEEKRPNVSEDDSQKNKNQVISKLTSDGDCDHLLILAQSAEMMLESEVNSSHRDDESNILENASDAGIEGKTSAVKQINGMPAINYRREESQSNVRTPRLTQIRHLARSRGKFPVQPMIGKHTDWISQGRRVRLTDIRRLARQKFQMCSQGEGEKQLSGNSGERTIRFSQLKQMARLKSDSLMFKADHDSIPAHLYWQTCEVGPDNHKAKIIEEIFGVEDSFRVVDGEALEEIISVNDRRKVSQLQT